MECVHAREVDADIRLGSHVGLDVSIQEDAGGAVGAAAEALRAATPALQAPDRQWTASSILSVVGPSAR
eukprot:6199667-Pleurochrysis_carterae.AAC.2